MRTVSVICGFLLASAVWATPKYEIKEYIRVNGHSMSQAYAAYNGAVQFNFEVVGQTNYYIRKGGVTTDLSSTYGLSYFYGSSMSDTVTTGIFRRPGNNTPGLSGYIMGDSVVNIPSNNPFSGYVFTRGVNDAGMLVGDDWVGGSSFRQIGFIYNTQTNGRTDLRLGNYTFAYGINNSGNVALSASGVEGDDGLGSAYTYVMHPDFSLKYLGEGSPRAINDSGQIASFFGTHFAWYQEGHAPISINWPKFDLAHIDGIDNNGIIVGSNYGVAFNRAFVASPVDGVFFLDDIVANLPSGMHLSDAIVDRVNGDIYAKLKTSAGATTDIVRLQSVPEPASISALALGISALFRRRSSHSKPEND
ncbi:MAG: PEP-CTERM sorting domain-containing protein [Armatimonadetes bacterium]|nr:PEP-CTERM sorting domain-containing protein [Armatimonadota bacterium]